MEIVVLIYILSVVVTPIVWSILIHTDYQNKRPYTSLMFLGVIGLSLIPVINIISSIWGIREPRRELKENL